MILRALNIDLEGTGIHFGQTDVDDFVVSAFQQMRNDKTSANLVSVN